MEKHEGKIKKRKYSRAWLALTVCIVILIIYTVYHVAYGLTESVPTTAAGIVTQSNSIVLEGVIFRDEETVKTQNQGDLRPYLVNGELASVDSAVAAVYSKSGNETLNARIAALEEELEILKQSNVKGIISVPDIDKLNAEIDSLYTSKMLALANGDTYRADKIDKELLVALNKMRIYDGSIENYDDEIAAIESELDTLYASFEGEKEYIFADKSGYFYHSCDGYENELTMDALASIDANGLKNILEKVKKEPIKSSEYKCKFVYGHEWKIATLCDDATSALLSEGMTYSATLFDFRERNIELTLERVGESKEGYTLLVFSCSTRPDGFEYSRYQSFKLDISSIEGYRIPKEALVTVKHKESGEETVGVYIVNASVITFKKINIIGESDGYYIAAKVDKSQEDYRDYLNLNDLIVLEPDGMYDGKLLIK